VADGIYGSQWGDEGKGKIVDYLCGTGEYDFCARWGGGNNAGHTIINERGEFAAHLIPVGISYEEIVCVIGNGVVVHLPSLKAEMDEMMQRGVLAEHLLTHLKISERAHVVMPWHIVMDKLQEKARGKEKIGTTSRGIGPVFGAKIERQGLRMGDLVHFSRQDLRKWSSQQLDRNLKIMRALYGSKALQAASGASEQGLEIDSADVCFQKLLELRDVFSPYVCNTQELLWQAYRAGKRILLEGAQGIHLDPDFGTYPYATSSPCTPAGSLQGTGLPPAALLRAIGVVKAYPTRVGQGPFPTRMDAGMEDIIREKGREYGATTGRPRSIGWPDLEVLCLSASLGITEWALTKLDILTGIDPIKICYAYEDRVGSPVSLLDMGKARPVYVKVQGWHEDIQECKSFADLPEQAKEFIKIIEQMTGIPVTLISTGPHRDQTIVR